MQLTGSFINNRQLPSTILHWRVSQVHVTARVATFQSRDFPAADHVTVPPQLWISDAQLHLQTLSLGEMVERRPFHHRPLEDVDFPPKDLLPWLDVAPLPSPMLTVSMMHNFM